MDDKISSNKKKTKKIFLQKGTCSGAFFYILNHDFGASCPQHEEAASILAGGIMRMGYQCGMLWGASLAAGTQAYCNSTDFDEAVTTAVNTTQKLLKSFEKRTGTIECSDIAQANLTRISGVAKYLISGKAFVCYHLAGNWAAEALGAAQKGLAQKERPSGQALSCAGEVIKKMGGSEQEAAMVAGFAGGLGLSGNGCGALAAALWLSILKNLKRGKKMGFKNPDEEALLKRFEKLTSHEILCSQITGLKFNSLQEHSAYIKNNGCKELIEALAQPVGPEN